MKQMSDGMIRILLALLCAWMVTGAAAAETLPVLEQQVTEDAVALYVPHRDEAGVVQAAVGEAVISTRVGEEDPEVITWMLFDNSSSIEETDREGARKLFFDYVGMRIPTERMNLCTFGERLNRLAVDSSDTIALNSQIQGIEPVNQRSCLTDALSELLDIEDQRQGTAYIRVLVFSDRAGSGGVSREELVRRLAGKNIPIYTIGCGTDSAALEVLYSLSSFTGVKSWNLSQLNSVEFASEFRYDESPSVIRIPIPTELRDGSIRTVHLAFDDGTTAQAQVQMPLAAPPANPDSENPASSSEPEPVPHADSSGGDTADEETPDSAGPGFPLVVLIAALAVLAAAGVVVCVVLVWKQKRNRPDNGGPGVLPQPIGGGNGGTTDFINGGNGGATDFINGGAAAVTGGGMTTPLDSGNGGRASGYTGAAPADTGGTRMVILADLAHPQKYFEFPLRDQVSIGRRPQPINQIVLDYDRSVSGRHCEIYLDGSACRVRDLGSSNGTFVDETQVQKTDSLDLADGNILRLGRLSFRVGLR